MIDQLTYAAHHYAYWVYVFLLLVGFHAMITHGNLLKKLIGMNIFQTAVILFFVATSTKRGATLPIVPKDAAGTGAAAAFMNPLPHALMLTAIVVMVATLGVALAVLIRIYRTYESFEEDVIQARM